MIPSIAENQTWFCEICGRPASEAHHIQHKSMGGGDEAHNLTDLCRPCHNRLHPEKNGGVGWTVSRGVDGLRVYEGKTLVVARWTPTPEVNWDQGVFLERLESTPDDLEARSSLFRFLDDEGMVAAGNALYRLHYAGWVARARLFRFAVLRTPYGTKTQRLRELANRFSIGGSQAWKEIEAVAIYEEHEELLQPAGQLPSPDMLVLAGRQPDPVKAIELLVDRRAANPHYSRITYAAELLSGATSDDTPPAYCECVCPKCGALARHRTPVVIGRRKL